MSFGKTLIKVILLPSTGVELVGGRDLGEEADQRRLALTRTAHSTELTNASVTPLP